MGNTDKDTAIDLHPEFMDKISIIADEVLQILKELSAENKHKINSALIVEKMVTKTSFKTLLNTLQESPELAPQKTSISQEDKNIIYKRALRDLEKTAKTKIATILPPFLIDKLSNLNDGVSEDNISSFLDSPVKVVKTYIDSILSKNTELENFMKQTMTYLSETEMQLTGELNSQQQKFQDDSRFEQSLNTNMNMIKKDCVASANIDNIKIALVSKIENINTVIVQKKEWDTIRLKETEKTLESMNNRMTEIKQEADDIKKNASEIEYESVRDSMTGLYNKKAYEQKIEEVLSDVKRYNVKASLIICDIDRCKSINDNFGHNVGDLALKKIAALLRERLRANDFIARYVDNKYVVILRHTEIKKAIKAADSIREYLDKAIISFSQKRIPLSLSIGISSIEKTDNSASAFDRAEKALLLAKKSGGNVVKSENDVITRSRATSNKAVKI
ncbi:MAG: GGDEF domain-containing protein [Nitrospira sp.]|nr:GGDEF domain-containing protein [Candidatus Brocadiales bacterium]MBL7048064.1 GGDEF domain-containing protein [Nitrospira sp.]